jgi:hypothetical protein
MGAWLQMESAWRHAGDIALLLCSLTSISASFVLESATLGFLAFLFVALFLIRRWPLDGSVHGIHRR